MNNTELDKLEDCANKQLEICKDVLEELWTLSKCTAYETGDNTISNLFQAGYCRIDRYGCINLKERGYAGDPNRSFGSIIVDQLIIEGKEEEFRAKFREEALPIYNKAREAKRFRMGQELDLLEERLTELQGDIE